MKLPHRTVFVDFEHRNRKLLCVVCAHRLPQHVNDLEEKEPCPFGCALGVSVALSIGVFIVPSDTRGGFYIYCE